MFTWIQRHQQTLLIIILVIVVIAFVWLYNPINDPRQLRQTQAGTIYGRPVTIDQFRGYQRLLEVSYGLELYNLLGGLMPQGGSEDPQQEFVWNLIVLREEADRLGLNPTEAQLREKIFSMPAFQENGQYREALRAKFVEEQLGPRGLGWGQAEQLVADSLRLQNLQDLLGATAVVDPLQTRQMFEVMNRQTKVQLARMTTQDLAGEITVNEEEAQQYYEGQKANFMSEPTVKLSYVKIDIPQAGEAGETGEGEEANQEAEDTEADADAGTDAEAQADAEPEPEPVSVEELQAVRDRAQEFTVQLYAGETDFRELAQQNNLDVQETEAFELDKLPESIADLPNVRQVLERLSPETPASDVLQTEDAYYIFHLDEYQEPRQLELEEVRDQVETLVKREKTQLRVEERSLQLRQELADEVKDAGDFAAKAEELGFEVMTPDPFTLTEPPQGTPFLSQVMQETVDIPAGEISEPISIPGGILLAFVQQREAAPEDEWTETRTMFRQGQQSRLLQQMTTQWFDAALADADFEPTYQ